MITESDIYKAVSDFISDSYDWLSDEANKEKSTQYILGLNDMARYIAEKLRESNRVTEELHELMEETKCP